jgi:hypothetical protein
LKDKCSAILQSNLQATGSVTTLEFQGRNVLGFDYLDDVSVTASPTPTPNADFAASSDSAASSNSAASS